MKISALRLFNVKRFAGRGVAIEGITDGVNVLTAANEFGKSTSFEALHALFFQPHSSVSADVRNLRPYSGGNPLVEVDIDNGEGRFRITKQYYGGRSARVTDLATNRIIAQADEAENFIASLIHGGTAGPAGLLWVRQGLTGIEKRSGSEEKGEQEVRRSLLESVQGEVEAITGGRRMAEIMAAVTQELDKLVTKRGAKAGGRYADALAVRENLLKEEQRLGSEVMALRDALDKRAHDLKRLGELERAEDRQERQNAVAKAQTAFEAARTQGEILKTAEAESRLAHERYKSAERERDAFKNALEDAGRLQDKRVRTQQQHSEAVSQRKSAAEAIARARAEADASEAAEQAARDRMARLDAALKARQAREQLARKQEQRERAEGIRKKIEEVEAEGDLVKIPPKALDELQDLKVEIAKMRAVEEAARASVAVSYENPASVAVNMDGVRLGDGDTRSYDGYAELSIAGVGTVTLHSNRPPRNDNRLEQAEKKQQTLLAAMGVTSLEQAREQQQTAQKLESTLQELRGQLGILVPQGLPALRAEIAAHNTLAADDLELKEDPEQVRADLAAAEEKRKETRQAAREAEPLQAQANEAYIEAETALAALNSQWAHIGSILGAEEQRGQREQDLTTALHRLETAYTEAEQRAQKLRASAVDFEAVEAALKRARSVDEAVNREIMTLREAVSGLNAEIRARSEEAVEEKWRETAEALTAAQSRVAAFEKEVAVLQRLAAALENARSEARELYLKPVVAELKPLLGLLFDDVAITFDDKTLLPQTILRQGQEEDVDRLSGGMREQLSILTRLAFARLLARDGRPAPVILDDALVYSDDERIEKMFDALHRQAKDQQIIVFSCRQRAFQKLGGTLLTLNDWVPQH